MLTERRDWFGLTIGLGGRRKFVRAPVEGGRVSAKKPHPFEFAQSMP
jgi:hypothetical protein